MGAARSNGLYRSWLLWISCVFVSPATAGQLTLEDAAYKAHADKGRDDHGYTSIYGMLFDAIRHRIRNVTEIGIHLGKSLECWHLYFPNAQLWGVDIAVQPQAIGMARKLGSRVHILPPADSTDPRVPSRLRLRRASMDIVIDDGDHRPHANAKTLCNFWPLVAPGGLYVVEDVATGSNVHGHYMNRRWLPLGRSGYSFLAHNSSGWPPCVREIYQANDVFIADALVGARDFDGFRDAMDGWMRNRVDHNSHLLVLRKRSTPRARPVTRFYGRTFRGARKTNASGTASI